MYIIYIYIYIYVYVYIYVYMHPQFVSVMRVGVTYLYGVQRCIHLYCYRRVA